MSLRKARVTVNLSPEPTASDDDSATKQLLAESQASPEKPRDPPKPSVVQHTTMLNAARRQVEPRSMPSELPLESSQTLDRQGSPTGKLKRPSFATADGMQPPRLRSRRKDVYDMSLSPEKDTQRSPFKLPETINKKPLKVVKKNRVARAPKLPLKPHSAPAPGVSDEGEAPANDGNIAQPEVANELPSSPPPYQAHAGDARLRKIRWPAGDEPVVSRVDWEKGLDTHSDTTSRPKRKADQQQTVPESVKLVWREKAQSPQAAVQELSTTSPKDNISRVKRHPQVVIPATKTDNPSFSPRKRRPVKGSTRTEEVQVGKLVQEAPSTDLGLNNLTLEADDETPTTAGHQEEPLVVGSDLPVPIDQLTERLTTSTENPPSIPSDRLSARPENIKTKRGLDTGLADKRKRTLRAKIKVPRRVELVEPLPALPPNNTSAVSQHPYNEDHDHAGDLREELQAEPGNRDTRPTITPPLLEDWSIESDEDYDEELPSLNRAFKYLDSEPRAGSCQTKRGKAIERPSLRARELVQNSDLTHDEVLNTTELVTARCKTMVGIKDKEHQSAFKADAYSYLFRALSLYLEAVYDWLREKYSNVYDSLPAMRIITPLVRDILFIEDTITSWKVGVPLHQKHDLKVVNRRLIVHLRKCYIDYRSQLSRLERAEQARKTREELRVQRSQQEQDEARKNDAQALLRERWVRWQTLHFRRMKYEPDPQRLSRLRITTKYEDLDERDANGVEFERLPVFRERSTPVPRTSPVEQDNWTDKQTQALLEGLEKFPGWAGFDHIFKKYCGPGGLLRKFNVEEITGKAIDIRSALLKQYQSKAWEIPDWLDKIPILP